MGLRNAKIKLAANERRSAFAFKSNVFNTSVEKDYFLNPGCFGDDVARWLISQLQASGYAAEERLGQEDFGWFFSFEAARTKHDVVIGYRPDADHREGEWLCWIERKAGLVGSMLGTRKRVEPEAILAVHQILSSSPSISSVRQCFEHDL